MQKYFYNKRLQSKCEGEILYISVVLIATVYFNLIHSQRHLKKSNENQLAQVRVNLEKINQLPIIRRSKI